MIRRMPILVRIILLAAGASTAAAGCDRSAAPTPESSDSAVSARLVVYYFHRTLRCATCLSIEHQTYAAIQDAFPDALARGRIEWRPVNTQEKGNEHFETDFALPTSSLVIVQMRGDEVVAWKNLDRVWELADQPDRFRDYVLDEVMAMLPG